MGRGRNTGHAGIPRIKTVSQNPLVNASQSSIHPRASSGVPSVHARRCFTEMIKNVIDFLEIPPKSRKNIGKRVNKLKIIKKVSKNINERSGCALFFCCFLAHKWWTDPYRSCQAASLARTYYPRERPARGGHRRDRVAFTVLAKG